MVCLDKINFSIFEISVRKHCDKIVLFSTILFNMTLFEDNTNGTLTVLGIRGWF